MVGDDDGITDSPAQHRFELRLGNEAAAAYYAIEDGRRVFLHTAVPLALNGQGFGSRLAHAAFENARTRGMRVIAKRPFISAYALKHPPYAAILDG